MRFARRTRIAGLAVFAVLFQAVLFGWHHHDLHFARHLPAPIVEHPALPPALADDADGCEICQVLHHLAAAPLEIFAAPLPHLIRSAASVESSVLRVSTLARAFLARGPPPLDAAVA